MQQPNSVPHLPKGPYYTITNIHNNLNLSMPSSNRFLKDKLELQQPNPNNINQIWMFEEISNNRYEIIHALSSLVLENINGSNNCKLQFGKRWASQLFYLEEIGIGQGKMESKLRRTQYESKMRQNNENNKSQTKIMHEDKGSHYQPPTPNVVNSFIEEEKMMRSRSRTRNKMKGDIRASFKNMAFRAGQRFVLQLRIKQREKSSKYLYTEESSRKLQMLQGQKEKDIKKLGIKFMQLDPNNLSDNSIWQIRQVFAEENQILSKCCYISSSRSGDVLDVPEASEKEGVQIIQYPCNFRFNQKWILQKVEDFNGYGYYLIKNAKSGLYLDIKGQSLKEGAPIIQYRNHKGKNQIWRLQQQGKRTYLIRSALDKDLLLGVKENSIKECAEIVTSKIESECFWVIYGFIPE